MLVNVSEIKIVTFQQDPATENHLFFSNCKQISSTVKNVTTKKYQRKALVYEINLRE